MSVIRKKPFIETVLQDLTGEQLNTLTSYINGSGTATEMVLGNANFSELTGIHYLKLKIDNLRTIIGFYIRNENYAVFISYNGTSEKLIVSSFDPNTWFITDIEEHLTIEELRRVIDDVTEASEGEVTNLENGSGTGSLQQVGSHAYGTKSVALGSGTVAGASDISSIGEGAHAEGINTLAHNTASHAEGTGCQARNGNAHAEGLNTNAVGPQSHAEGDATYTHEEAGASHAEGQATHTYGVASHAGGYNVTAKGYAAFGHGLNNTVYSDVGTVFGNENTLGTPTNSQDGVSSTILGSACSIKKSSSSLIGGLDCHLDNTESPSYQSIVYGWGLKGSGSNNKAIFGRWNANDSSALLEIGNGTADNVRSNAFAVYENGTIKIGNTTLTEAQLQTLLAGGSGGGSNLYKHTITGLSTVFSGATLTIINDDATKLNTAQKIGQCKFLSAYLTGGALADPLKIMDTKWYPASNKTPLCYLSYGPSSFSLANVDIGATSLTINDQVDQI